MKTTPLSQLARNRASDGINRPGKPGNRHAFARSSHSSRMQSRWTAGLNNTNDVIRWGNVIFRHAGKGQCGPECQVDSSKRNRDATHVPLTDRAGFPIVIRNQWSDGRRRIPIGCVRTRTCLASGLAHGGMAATRWNRRCIRQPARVRARMGMMCKQTMRAGDRVPGISSQPQAGQADQQQRSPEWSQSMAHNEVSQITYRARPRTLGSYEFETREASKLQEFFTPVLICISNAKQPMPARMQTPAVNPSQITKDLFVCDRFDLG